MAVSARFLTTPLGVDLHGTLVRSDVLLESLLLLLKQNPLYLFLALAWLLRGGKAGLAAQLASRVRLNPAALLYNADLVAWLKTERAMGRPIWLCAPTNARLATTVAQHLGLFDRVVEQPAGAETDVPR